MNTFPSIAIARTCPGTAARRRNRALAVNKYVTSGLSRHKRFTACTPYRYFEYNINSKDVLHVFLCLSKAIR